MSQRILVSYRSDEQLRADAASFLRTYHACLTIPVPIEEIIELKLRIDIIPLPGLKKEFEADAFITSDMESIYVDQYIHANVPTRYRFSLAHEIAHAVLHQKVYRSQSFTDVRSWKQMQQTMPEKEYGWLEWQAYAFAGFVLVPADALRSRFSKAIEAGKQSGFAMDDLSDGAKRLVCGYLARAFDVSTEVIERRLDKDSLWTTCSSQGDQVIAARRKEID